jgi:uncharacterized RDD family membrane protein YckC
MSNDVELGGVAVNQPVAAVAGFWVRFFASLVDMVLLVLVLLVFQTILGVVLGVALAFAGIPMERGSDASTIVGATALVASVLVAWIFCAAMESSANQATPGKMVFGLVATAADGSRLSFHDATVRHFAKYLSTLSFLAGYFMVGFTEKKQGLHDLVAGSLVVKKAQ